MNDLFSGTINVTLDPKSAMIAAAAIFVAVFLAFMAAYFVFYKHN